MNPETLFHNRCKIGNLEGIKELLSLPWNNGSAEAYLTINEGFRWACLHGHLPVVSYLLTSPDLPQKALIHSHNDSAINNAVKNGHVTIIEYLLYSPALTDHIDLEKNLLSCIEQAIGNEQRTVLEYFIFQLNIPLTTDLMALVKEKVSNIEDQDWGKTVLNLFNTQILYNQLQKKITNKLPMLDNKINQKVKI